MISEGLREKWRGRSVQIQVSREVEIGDREVEALIIEAQSDGLLLVECLMEDREDLERHWVQITLDMIKQLSGFRSVATAA
jgi:hypothetical protein